MQDCACRECGRTFQYAASQVLKGRGQFCTRKCALAFGRRARWEFAKRDAGERLVAFVVKRGPDQCWGWTGFKFRGYGRLRTTSGVVGAHRIAYEMAHGPIPTGMTVLHRCDNPECTNPHHLMIGTNQDNNADRNAKGRQAKGETHARAVLTDDEVRSIRGSDESGPVLAGRYGVTKATIYAIKRGRTWRHLD